MYKSDNVKIVGVRYPTIESLEEDCKKAFPAWDGVSHEVENVCFVKGEVFDENGVSLGFDGYLILRDEFILPDWIQGELIPQSEYRHTFLGY
jgi:hypothetical protein